MADQQKSAYELERDERVKANKQKMQELGLQEAAAELQTLQAAKPERKKKEKPTGESVEPSRRSERPRKEVSYCEIDKPVREHVPVDYTQRIKAVALDAETAERLRAEMDAKRSSTGKGGKGRGPVDSGKGVRIQGGRVYDSKHGVTCHWCRQKTLEDHVTCTNPNCGNGKRMPLSFCSKCLKNRHGEDFEAADASGGWWCPSCRGSCGAGCVTCCNCGPCRKRAGLEPTHQVVKLARDAGFSNVHDYLVHLVTGETQEQIAARKLQFGWGAWLKIDSSDASEQTAGCCAHKHHEELTQEQQADSGKLDQGKVTDYFRVRKPTSCRNQSASGKGGKAAGMKRKADVAPAQDKQQEGSMAEGNDCEATADASVELGDAPQLSSHDTKLSRKQRIMQRMGLAPVTAC